MRHNLEAMDQLAGEVDDVMNNVISEKSRSIYLNCIVRFVAFLQQNRTDLLSEDFKTSDIATRTWLESRDRDEAL